MQWPPTCGHSGTRMGAGADSCSRPLARSRLAGQAPSEARGHIMEVDPTTMVMEVMVERSVDDVAVSRAEHHAIEIAATRVSRKGRDR
jgi:hypothetical protein